MTLIGKTIGHIRIVDILGKGGMGEVYVGFDETLERKVALKAIQAKSRLNPQAKARFLREARVLSQLEHPSICQIHDYIEGEEIDFLVLEFIEGTCPHRLAFIAMNGSGTDSFSPKFLKTLSNFFNTFIRSCMNNINMFV